ncbi:MAG: SH3 domain-containing protein [Candidatus Rifleibacteriota bacterium]
MKKAKLISILVIMLSVIALGVFMGKQMFKLIESGTETASNTSATATSSVQILYSSDSSPDLANVPAPEVTPVTTTSEAQAAAQNNISSNTVATVEPKPVEGEKNGFSPDGPKWFAYASGNGINVRTGPDTSTKLMFKVAKGTRGTVVEKKNGWTKIKWDFNRQLGWVRDDLLVQGPAEVVSTLVEKTGDVEKLDAKQINKASAEEILKASKVIVAVAKEAPVAETVKSFVEGEKLPEQAKISADPFANIRSGPGPKHSRVAKLPKGVVVKINKVQREEKWLWFEISFNEGKKTGWTREDNLSF